MSPAGAVWMCFNKQCNSCRKLFWPTWDWNMKWNSHMIKAAVWIWGSKSVPRLCVINSGQNLRVTAHVWLHTPLLWCSWLFVGVCFLPSMLLHIQLQLHLEQLLTRTQPVPWRLSRNVRKPDHRNLTGYLLRHTGVCNDLKSLVTGKRFLKLHSYCYLQSFTFKGPLWISALQSFKCVWSISKMKRKNRNHSWQIDTLCIFVPDCEEVIRVSITMWLQWAISSTWSVCDMYKYEAFTSLAQSAFILPEIRK